MRTLEIKYTIWGDENDNEGTAHTTKLHITEEKWEEIWKDIASTHLSSIFSQTNVCTDLVWAQLVKGDNDE